VVDPGRAGTAGFAVGLEAPLGDGLLGGVDGDLGGAVVVGAEPGDTGTGALGDDVAVEGVVPRRGHGTAGVVQAERDGAEVEGGTGRVVADQPVAVGTVDVGAAPGAVGDGREVAFEVPRGRLLAVRAGPTGGRADLVVPVRGAVLAGRVGRRGAGQRGGLAGTGGGVGVGGGRVAGGAVVGLAAAVCGR